MPRIGFLLLLVSLISCSSTPERSSNQSIYIDDESGSYDEYGAPYWTGPGLYWGIHISNEDEYWRHYNQRYPNKNQEQPIRRAGDGRRGVRGDEGATGGRQ